MIMPPVLNAGQGRCPRQHDRRDQIDLDHRANLVFLDRVEPARSPTNAWANMFMQNSSFAAILLTLCRRNEKEVFRSRAERCRLLERKMPNSAGEPSVMQSRRDTSPAYFDRLGDQPDRQLSDAYALIRPTVYGTALLALCILVGMAEGYDVQAMSLAAPLLAHAWHLAPQAVGMLLSSSLIGQVVGGFLLAPLGDRLGRRTALLMGLAIAGSATYAGAFMPGFGTMMASRLVAGLGLGLALANTVTLAMELVPSSWRAIAVILVSSGYPLGTAAGAAAVGMLLPGHGVAMVFYVGGASTLVCLLFCFVLMPESPVMLVRRPGDQASLRAVFKRLGVIVNPAVHLVGLAAAAQSNVAALFTPERRSTTLLLWLLNFSSLSLVFFFVMWLPSLFVNSGFDPRDAIRATSLFFFSGILGGLTLATLMSRIGPVLTLGACYVLTIFSVITFATVSASSTAFLPALYCCGFLITGSQFCLQAVTNLFYPGPIRATGLGFALGAGRIGGVIAPLVGGFVLAHVGSPSQAFYIAVVPGCISLLALVALRHLNLVGLDSE